MGDALPTWDTFDSDSSAGGAVPGSLSPRSDESADLSIYKRARGTAAAGKVSAAARGGGRTRQPSAANQSNTFSESSLLLPDGMDMRARLRKLHARFRGGEGDGAMPAAGLTAAGLSSGRAGSGSTAAHNAGTAEPDGGLPSLDVYLNAAASSAPDCAGFCGYSGAAASAARPSAAFQATSPSIRQQPQPQPSRSAVPLGELRDATNRGAAEGALGGLGVGHPRQYAAPAETAQLASCPRHISLDADDVVASAAAAATTTAADVRQTQGMPQQSDGNRGEYALGDGAQAASPAASAEEEAAVAAGDGLAEAPGASVHEENAATSQTIADVKARAYARMSTAFTGQLTGGAAEAAEAAVESAAAAAAAAASEAAAVAAAAEAAAVAQAEAAEKAAHAAGVRAAALLDAQANERRRLTAAVEYAASAAAPPPPTTTLGMGVPAVIAAEISAATVCEERAGRASAVMRPALGEAGEAEQDCGGMSVQGGRLQQQQQQQQQKDEPQAQLPTQLHMLAHDGAEMFCDVDSPLNVDAPQDPAAPSFGLAPQHYGEEEEFWAARQQNLESVAAQIAGRSPAQQQQQQQQQQQPSVAEQQFVQLQRQQQLAQLQEQLKLQEQRYAASAGPVPSVGAECWRSQENPVHISSESDIIARMSERIDSIATKLDLLAGHTSARPSDDAGRLAELDTSAADAPHAVHDAGASVPNQQMCDGPDPVYDAVAQRIQKRVTHVLGVLQTTTHTHSDEMGSGSSPFGALKRMLEEEASHVGAAPTTPASVEPLFGSDVDCAASSPFARRQASTMLSSLEQSMNDLLAAIRENERGRSRAYKLGLEKLQQSAALARQARAQAALDAGAQAEAAAASKFADMQQQMQDELCAASDAHAMAKASSDEKIAQLNAEVAALNSQLEKKDVDQQHEIDYALYKQRKAYEEQASEGVFCEQSIRTQHSKELEEARDKAAAEVAQVQSDVRAEIELWTSRARAGEERAIRVHSELTEQHGQQLRQLKEAHERALGLIRSKTATLHEEHDAYIRGLHQQHEHEMQEMQHRQLSAAQADRERLERRLTKAHAEQMRAATEQHATEIGRAGARITQLRRDHDKASEDLATRQAFRGEFASGIRGAAATAAAAAAAAAAADGPAGKTTAHAAGITVVASSSTRRDSGSSTGSSDGGGNRNASLDQTSADVHALVTRIRSRTAAGAESAGPKGLREQSPRREAPQPLAMPTRHPRSRLHSPVGVPAHGAGGRDSDDDITPMPHSAAAAKPTAGTPGASALAKLDNYLASTGIRDT